MAVAMLLTVIATGNLQLLIARAPNYVFVQNYFPYAVRWNHSWSIAVEEHFYLLLPLVLLVLIPAKRKKLPQILLSVCVFVLAFRVFLFFLRDLPWSNFYYPTHMRIDSLSFGVLLGYLYQYKTDAFIRVGRRFWPLFLAGPMLLILANIFPVETSAISYTLGFTVFYLVFGGLVVVARAYPDFGRSGPQRLLALAGVYSYTIYLAHSVLYELPGMTAVRNMMFPHFGTTGDRVLFFALSIVLGVVLSHLIERPFLRLRAKWLPSHTERGSIVYDTRPATLTPHLDHVSTVMRQKTLHPRATENIY
jgi:peptidoglycan/LPS O-acetylase OafA/YrhL